MNGRRNDTRIGEQRLIEGVIGALPLFWGATAEGRAALAAQCWALPAARGAVVLAQGTRPPGVFAVAYGAVKTVLRRPDRAERVLRLVSARETFGDSSALLGRPSPYEALAIEQAKLVVIPTQALVALMDREPRFARGLVMALAARKSELYAEMEAATLLSSTQRLAFYLTELASNDAGGEGAAGARVVTLPFSKTLVASRLGVQKETLSRLLRDLVERGVIAMTRREIEILEPERLDRLARSGE